MGGGAIFYCKIETILKGGRENKLVYPNSNVANVVKGLGLCQQNRENELVYPNSNVANAVKGLGLCQQNKQQPITCKKLKYASILLMVKENTHHIWR